MKQTTTNREQRHSEAGFSLIELIVAMAVTLVISGIAVTLLSASFSLRSREDRKSDAIADVRRTLNAMTREIANSGYGLPSNLPVNGIVAADSNNTSIRILSNSDRFNGGATPDTPTSQDEDVVYRYVNDTATAQRYVVRFDVNSSINGTSVLANRIDSFTIHYYSQKVVYTPTAVAAVGVPTCTNSDITNVLTAAGGTAVSEVSPDQATYIVLTACVQLGAIGQAGQVGYQPPTVQQLTSDVQLRNATAISF